MYNINSNNNINIKSSINVSGYIDSRSCHVVYANCDRGNDILWDNGNSVSHCDNHIFCFTWDTDIIGSNSIMGVSGIGGGVIYGSYGIFMGL